MLTVRNQEFLIDAGHEDGSVSRNNDFETPLMFAAMAGKEETGVMLAKRFPECIPWENRAGLDAVRTLPAHCLPDAPLTPSSSCSPANPAAAPST